MLSHMLLALSLATAPQAAQNAALKIVVIEGEAGVNIIQQKTAVKPVIEVRDRNNLPVPGVLVTFSIEGGKAATFGGASTLTVATNAAGEATVSSLTPTVSGAFHIQVSAAFQGQIATTTIAQTNVMTAAQAAAAAGSGGAGGGAGAGGAGGGAGSASGAAAGGAAGAGGGISATTIAIAGAAVAGGAVAATQVADKVSGGGEAKFAGTFSGTINGTVTGGNNNCSFTYTITGATARLRFEQFSDSAVKGVYEYDGPSSLTASTCQFSAPPIPQFIGSTEVTGTPANFGGKRTITPSAGTENNYIFQGSISGNTATGTFTYDQRSTNTDGAGGTVTMVAIGTFPITFQKQ